MAGDQGPRPQRRFRDGVSADRRQPHRAGGHPRAHSPALEYDFYLFNTGECQLHIDCLPTKPVAPGRGVRLAISLDGAGPQSAGRPARARGDVLANLRRYTTTVTIEKPGRHTLTVWMVDPGVVLDKIVLYFCPPKESYLGPPESYRR